MLDDFFQGFGLCLRGFRAWGSQPKLMALGAIPAVIVGLGLIAAIVALGFALPDLIMQLTPFANSWSEPWLSLTRVFMGIAILVGAGVLGVLLYAALTTLIGQPFYERIWRATENDLGGIPNEVSMSIGQQIGRAIGDSLRLAGIAIVTAIVVFLLGLIPLVGGVIGLIVGQSWLAGLSL